MNDNDRTIKCRKCGREVHWLEVFPGKRHKVICIECYEEEHRDDELTQEGLDKVTAFFGGKAVK